uniref:MRCK/ROCK kinase PH domain-containing protein n=1 Tax=Romanomermis culicivorax TaxID=13658 RepID=A0A915KLN2_ROMCU
MDYEAKISEITAKLKSDGECREEVERRFGLALANAKETEDVSEQSAVQNFRWELEEALKRLSLEAAVRKRLEAHLKENEQKLVNLALENDVQKHSHISKVSKLENQIIKLRENHSRTKEHESSQKVIWKSNGNGTSVSENSGSKSCKIAKFGRRRKMQETIQSYNQEIKMRDIRIKTLENSLIAYAHQIEYLKGKSIDTMGNFRGYTGDKNQSSTDYLEKIEKLEAQVKWEEQLKNEAIVKLHQVLVGPKIVKQDVKMNQAYQRLQFDLKQEKKKFMNLSIRYRKEMDDLRASLYESDQKIHDLKIKNKCLNDALFNRGLRDKKGDDDDEAVEEISRGLESENVACSSKEVSDQNVGEDHQNLPDRSAKIEAIEGYYSSGDALLKSFVSTPLRKSKYKKGWNRQFAVVCNNRIYFYDQIKGDDHSTTPSFILPLNKIFRVRHVAQADARFANPSDISRIFQLIYSEESDRIVHELQDLEKSANSEMTIKEKPVALCKNGHDFIRISFQTPVSCEICSKPLWGMIEAPAAFECQ